MNTQTKRVVIIGGGIIGTSCAHYLLESGWKVTIIDRGEFGKECSHGNCGLVCPSHVLPLAEPGAVTKALASLFRKDSPFYIKPRFDPALWSWLLSFARRCNTSDMMKAGRACQALLNSSILLYRELFELQPIDCEWETRGLLYVFLRRTEMDEYARTDELLNDSFDVCSTRYDGNGLIELEPALKPGLAGGWLYGCDAHLRPDKLLASWRCVLEDRGVIIREHCQASGFIAEHGQAQEVRTTQGDIPAEAFLVAAGALTPRFRKSLGCKIPIQPGKGYSITMPRPAKCPNIPLIFPSHSVVVTPMRSGYRLGSTMEFSGYDATLDHHRLELLKSGASHYLNEPYCEPIEEEWFGWRPMTYDSVPIIDNSPAMENVFVAAGHNMLGLSMAPATGKLIAELLGGDVPHIDPRPYSVTRFQ